MSTRLNLIPDTATLVETKEVTKTDKLFTFKLAKPMDYKPGQFVQISIFGAGEVPISISTSQHVIDQDHLELVVRKVGKVTSKIHELKIGNKVGIRGPYGTAWPIEKGFGRNVVVIAGGTGLCPLRGVILEFIRNKDKFKDVKLLYGARTPSLISFKDELETWKNQINTCVTVDEVPPNESWEGYVGNVTTLFDKHESDINVEDPLFMICGPPIMMHFVCKELEKSGFKDTDIYVSLERHMKCGVGNCGHCTVGNICVCIDGPVFSLDQVKDVKDAVYLF